ncbi:5'-methylthioadenosine/S-adenosylhomocysteine nucleosidase [Bacillus nitratireducens]|uniref:5'-methylthioadenosine/S-adenosylhomocysteine nucleosidase n=1 Tax=Bacillus nitratireducens TaxID=2026193 RepID=UPI00089AAB86|nr:5'-methylthioadenosine/S-adenosylhomocysteine nucleosidase [Bacillus nitratireducens]PFH75241.1 5'-methylthioadenosine/S-adenosylhomocysteine nucleosidase [Bacillus cereus]SEB22200.1 methylthioadenosine nucleosidase /adenosylhomocysteine nucleosidase [Bacillus nitratireducens]
MKRIGIIAAWQPELNYLHEEYPSRKVRKIAAWEFHYHSINNLEIISVISGVGKTNCSSCTQLLISEFRPDEIYMTGICGSLPDSIKGGEIVIARQMLQHDVTNAGKGDDVWDLYTGRTSIIDGDNSIFSDFLNFAINTSEHKINNGMVISGDQRIREDVLRLSLSSTHNAIAVDQEIASFSYVSYVNKIPFLCVKSVSDQADNKTIEDQKRFKLLACKNSCKLLIEFLLR